MNVTLHRWRSSTFVARGAAGSAALLTLLGAAGFACCSPARADELYIKGGVIEGRVVDETRDGVRIETPTGLLLVPRPAITRTVRGVSRLERYAAERGKVPLTAARHTELARWCEEEGLRELARQHVKAALELDPLLPEALRLAGYVPLGAVWLYTGPPEPVAGQRPQSKPDAMVESLMIGWLRRVRAIQDTYFARGSSADSITTGRLQLLSLNAPLVIPAACRSLGAGDADARTLLVQMLGGFEEDEARLNLMVLALLDPEAQVREAAAIELARIGDERFSALLREALRCSTETIVRRAAVALGTMRDKSATDDLIAALSARAASAPPTPAGLAPEKLLKAITAAFAKPMLVPLTDAPYQRPPAIVLPNFNQFWSAATDAATAPTGRLRSEVQDALILITGVNFGFDVEAWQEWRGQGSDTP